MKGNSVTQMASFPDWRKIWASRHARLGLTCSVIFLLALMVRAFHLQDNPTPPFHGMTGEYKAHALALVRGDIRIFLRGPNPPSDANVIKHPPGYPLLMAAVYKLSGDSDKALRSLHIFLDGVSVILVFLLAYELSSFRVATVSAFLVALSPQLAYHSTALLPDPIATLPLLLAFYLFIRSVRRPRAWVTLGAGVLIGISCWFRSNALLLPLFLAALMPLFFSRGTRLRQALALVGGAIVTIVPVTIRNYLGFRSIIPLSLSAGITLIVGIGLYDKDGRFGLPATDIGVTQWEARIYNRPDYLCGRFAPDGVVREHLRAQQGLKIIRENPLWFLGVMAHRAFSMLRLVRVENVAAQPAVTQPLEGSRTARPAWSFGAAEIYGNAHYSVPQLSLVNVSSVSQKIETNAIDCGPYVPPIVYAETDWVTQVANDQAVRFSGDASSELFAMPEIHVIKNSDYLLRFPLRIQQGSIIVAVVDARRGNVLASTPVLHSINWAELAPEQQPFIIVERPFVSYETDQVRVVLINGYRKPQRIITDIAQADVFELGSSSATWTRYPRAVISAGQRLFLTAVMLPFALIGVALLIRWHRYQALAILVVVPIYYMCVQSALWTEFRYTLPMYYFLFILTAVGLVWVGEQLWRATRKLGGAAKEIPISD